MPGRLGFGTAGFTPGYGIDADPVERADVVALLHAALHAGIDYIDTAPAYGDAESIIGELAGPVLDRGIRVCTKVPLEAARGDTAAAVVRQSLERLRMPRVDTLMVHNATSEALEDPRVATRLQSILDERSTQRLGASTYGSAAARVAAETSWCTAIQVEHSILNQSVMASLQGAMAGVEVVARSVLCKGLLTDRRHAAAAPASELSATLDDLATVAEEWGGTLPELAIRFALDSPGVDVVVVGISSRAELDTALRAAGRTPLSAAEMALLSTFDRSDADAVHPERWSNLTPLRSR